MFFPENRCVAEHTRGSVRVVRVKDRLWIFAVEQACDDTYYNIPITRVTPVEGAYYLGVERLAMIVSREGPYPPLEPYLRIMRPLKEVVWSIVDSGGVTGWAQGKELDMLCDLACRFPNITGIFMDDFFNGKPEDGYAVHSIEKLTRIREKLVLPHRTLDLWAVLYRHQLDLPVIEHLNMCDVVSFWEWWGRELPHLETNLEKLERLVPDKRRSLGIYLWDYGDRAPMPLDLMQHQCRLGLEWLKSGRIDSMMFLTNYLLDQDFEAVEWTREWIAEVGDEVLAS